MNQMHKGNVVPALITRKILDIRGFQVMLDMDLAELYQVETRVLKQAVRRNIDVFPASFMFELTHAEFDDLRSHFVISNQKSGGTRYLPMAFTEHGILQAANVLRSPTARQMSIRIIELFIEMRELMMVHKGLITAINDLSSKVSVHDDELKQIFEYLRQLEKTRKKASEYEKRKRIGYQQGKDGEK